MTRSGTDTDMLAGYWDGLNGEPKPGPNRSQSYRHGWKNGSDDRYKSPLAAASYILEDANKARDLDLSA